MFGALGFGRPSPASLYFLLWLGKSLYTYIYIYVFVPHLNRPFALLLLSPHLSLASQRHQMREKQMVGGRERRECEECG